MEPQDQVEPLSIKDVSLIYHIPKNGAHAGEGGPHARKCGTGIFKLAGTGAAWRDTKTKEVFKFFKKDLSNATWKSAKHTNKLCFFYEGDGFYEFSGFPDDVYPVLASHFTTHFELHLDLVEQAVGGMNWGNLDVQSTHLSYTHPDGKTIFEVPLSSIVSAQIGKPKADLGIELGGLPQEAVCQLVDMRFLVKEHRDEHDPLSSANVSASGPLRSELMAAQLNQLASSRHKTAAGNSILAFEGEIAAITPRGRYEVEFFESYINFKGKTYNHTLRYLQISRIFEMPNPDQSHLVYLGMLLDIPLRQGNTAYPFLVLQFFYNQEDEPLSFKLHMDASDILKKYPSLHINHPDSKSTLPPNCTTYERFQNILEAVSLKRVLLPDQSLQINERYQAVGCSVKAESGFLYFFAEGLLFIHKPCKFIHYREIESLILKKVSTTSRVFSITVHFKSAKESTIEFLNITRDSYDKIAQYLRSKVHIVHEETEGFEPSASASRKRAVETLEISGDSEDDDDDETSDDEFDPTALKKSKQQEGSSGSSDEGSAEETESGSSHDETSSSDEDEDDSEAEGASKDKKTKTRSSIASQTRSKRAKYD